MQGFDIFQMELVSLLSRYLLRIKSTIEKNFMKNFEKEILFFVQERKLVVIKSWML